MDRLKAWLNAKGITIGRPKVQPDGLLTLRLHPPIGRPFDIDFYPEDLEDDPDNAIATIEKYLSTRRIVI